MASQNLPVNVDSTYADSTQDPSVKSHQQAHDKIHQIVNWFDKDVAASDGYALVYNAATGLYRPVDITGGTGSVTPTDYASAAPSTMFLVRWGGGPWPASRPSSRTNIYFVLQGAPEGTANPTWLLPGDFAVAAGQPLSTAQVTAIAQARVDAYAASNSGTPITDHGALAGLTDDDHTQYFNVARGDLRYYTRAQVDSAIAAAISASSLEDRNRANHYGTDSSTSTGTAPSAPASPSVAPGEASIVLTWVAPPDGGSPITGYDLQPFIGTTGGTVVSVGNVLNTTLTGMTPGTTYTVKIRAKNVIGNSPYSTSSASVVPVAAMPVANMRARWESSSITSPPANGTGLATWTDLSGNGKNATQATSARRPIYRTTGTFLPKGGQPCVEFAAASQHWLDAAVTNSGATTVYVVARFKTVATSQALISSDGGYELAIDTANDLVLDVPNIASLNANPTPTVWVAGRWYVIAFTSNGSNAHRTYVNGVAEGTSTVAGTAVATALNIGGRGWNAGVSGFDGYLAAVIPYGVVHTPSEVAATTDVLTAKYVAVPSNPAVNLDFDFDSTLLPAGQDANTEGSAAHQFARITSPTRLGTGQSLRTEIHNNASDGGAGTYRALMAVYDTNDGGVAGGTTPAGPNDVYWCFSSYIPTSGAGDANATVVAGSSQTALPNYTHLFEIHERDDDATPGLNSLGAVANHAIMINTAGGAGGGGPKQLQYRGRCGTFTRTAVGQPWTSPNWNINTPGTNGSNDTIPIPIVKSGSTDSSMIINAWVDVIFHCRFATDSTGLIEVWARQAGQAFTTSPNLTITGPTHKVLITGGVTATTAGYDATNGHTGCYLEVGLYNGASSWGDTSQNAHVHIIDELRRWSTLAEAKANWG